MSQRGANPLNIPGDSVRTIPFSQSAPGEAAPNRLYGNVIRIRFSYPQSFNNCEIALKNLFLFNSWYNITAQFGNNAFAYTYPTGSGYNTYNVVVLDGNYSIDTLNEYYEAAQVVNGTYLIDNNGNNVYYSFFGVNNATYRVVLMSNPVPNTLPAGWTLPSNYPAGGLPSTPEDPQLVVNATGAPAGSNTPGLYSFSKTIGFVPGTYPANSVATAGTPSVINGQFAPRIEYTSNVNIAASIVNNGSISQLVNVFYSFTPLQGQGFGSQISIEPPYPGWVPISGGGEAQYIDISIQDDVGNLLQLQDPGLSGTIIIRGT